MKELHDLKVIFPFYRLPGDSGWEWRLNTESITEFPVGSRVIVCDSRVTFFQPDQAVSMSFPFASRFVADPDNPRVEHYTGDPDGLEYPCLSTGWGPDWWTDPDEIDQAAYAKALVVARAEPLGIDLAMWDNEARGEGKPRVLAWWINKGLPLREYGLIRGISNMPLPPGTGPVPEPAPLRPAAFDEVLRSIKNRDYRFTMSQFLIAVASARQDSESPGSELILQYAIWVAQQAGIIGPLGSIIR